MSSPTFKTVWMDDGQPEYVKPLIGLTVRRMWIRTDKDQLVVQLENPAGGCRWMAIQGVHVDIPGAARAVEVRISAEKLDNTDPLFASLDRACPPSYDLWKLFRRKFTGLDGTIVMFGNEGIQVQTDGIEFVRKRNSD